MRWPFADRRRGPWGVPANDDEPPDGPPWYDRLRARLVWPWIVLTIVWVVATIWHG